MGITNVPENRPGKTLCCAPRGTFNGSYWCFFRGWDSKNEKSLIGNFFSLVAIILSWGWWEVFLCGLFRFLVSSVIVCVLFVADPSHCSLWNLIKLDLPCQSCINTKFLWKGKVKHFHTLFLDYIVSQNISWHFCWQNWVQGKAAGLWVYLGLILVKYKISGVRSVWMCWHMRLLFPALQCCAGWLRREHFSEEVQREAPRPREWSCSLPWDRQVRVVPGQNFL